MSSQSQSASTAGTSDRAPVAGPIDPAPELPLAITHAAMNAAYDKGEATPLAASMTWLIRYQDSWWVVYERGWLRVTDTATAKDLDQAANRLTLAESTTTPDPGNAM